MASNLLALMKNIIMSPEEKVSSSSDLSIISSNKTEAKKKLKILLIEDNPSDVRLLSIYLQESYGKMYSLSTAGSLTKTLDILNEDTFDVIIVDLGLKDRSGIESFKNVFERSPHTPVIILTGMIDEQLGTNAIKLGAQDFLNKGLLKGDELKRSINYSLERFKILKETASATKNKLEKDII